MSGPLGHGSTAGIGSKVGSEAPGALVSFNPLRPAEFPEASRAVVRAAWSPQRRGPSHSDEMVSQVVLGELVEIGTSEGDWMRVVGPDGYPGWVHRGALLPAEPDEADRWERDARMYSLGTLLLDAPGGAPCAWAPWGSRLPIRPDGAVLTPAGTVAYPAREDRLVVPDPTADGRSLCESAREWLGAPYHWGGRLRSGTDCSGFVQAVHARHGVRLPRDSRDQFDGGTRLPDYDPSEGQPGDLWFFAWDGSPVSHVGICLGGHSLLHASETRGEVAVDTLRDETGGGQPASRNAFGLHLARGFVGALRPLG